MDHNLVLADAFTFYVCNPDLAQELLGDLANEADHQAEYNVAREALRFMVEV